jgi:hypothetical protein
MAGTIVATTSARKGQGLIRINCALTCVSGAISAQTIGSAFGRIVAAIFEPTAGGGATMTSTADLTITDAATGAVVFSTGDFGTARSIRPTQVITSNVGVAVTAAATAVDVNRDIFVAGKLNLAIANATTTDTGYFGLVIQEA